jgi:serine/threonine-protein kinase
MGDEVAGLVAGARVAERYRLVRLLGKGGMGVVWEAFDAERNEPVALKFLHGMAANRPAMKRRFLREGRALMMIDHPNVVHTREITSSADGSPVIVMDLLVGETLGQRLAREGAMQIGEVANLLLPILSAVGQAHAHGIVHRDLKPDNVFLVAGADPSARVRVLDFGVAKFTAPGEPVQTSETSETVSAALTATGALVGTPQYMSPEQVFGEKDVDHRADVWALGAILYECLAGKRAVLGDNVGQMIKMITSGRIQPLAEAAPHMPPKLAELVTRMLAADREARPSDLREVLDVLREYTTLRVEGFEAPIAPLDVAESAATPEPSSPRSWRAFAVGLGAAAIVGTGAVAVLRASPRPAQAVPAQAMPAQVLPTPLASPAAPSAPPSVATPAAVVPSASAPGDTARSPPRATERPAARRAVAAPPPSASAPPAAPPTAPAKLADPASYQ